MEARRGRVRRGTAAVLRAAVRARAPRWRWRRRRRRRWAWRQVARLRAGQAHPQVLSACSAVDGCVLWNLWAKAGSDWPGVEVRRIDHEARAVGVGPAAAARVGSVGARAPARLAALLCPAALAARHDVVHRELRRCRWGRWHRGGAEHAAQERRQPEHHVHRLTPAPFLTIPR
jgi:hypothetical protein